MGTGAASGIAGHSLSTMILAMLVRKGVLTQGDAAEVVEHALLALESYDHLAKEGDLPDFDEARQILTFARQGFRLEE